MIGLHKALLVAVGLLFALPAAATDTEFDSWPAGGWGFDAWTLQTSLYTTHFDPEPDHVNDQNVLAVEAYFKGDWLAGLALFENSFGQSSQLIYAGKTWPLFDSPYWYTKLTGGLLHGYEGPYEDKIPLNGLGVAPVIIPALGFRYRYFVTEANLGGLAVIMVTAGVRF
jgi:hypothetical protein